MASIDYPKEVLPLPLVASATVTESDRRLLRTSMDSGYTVVRKRFTTVPVDFVVNLIYTQSQLSYFQAWYANTLDHGLNWFNMELPVGDSLLSVHEVRFSAEPAYSLEGKLWKVAFKIQGVAMNLGIDYDVVMLGLIESLGGFDAASLYFSKLDVAINTTYPSSGYGPGV